MHCERGTRRAWGARVVGAALLSAAALCAGPAAAGDEGARAAKLFEEGAAAEEAGSYEAAARLFAEADALMPNEGALEAALSAAVLADAPGLSMELAVRAEERGAGGALKGLCTDARARFQGRAGRLRVTCAGCAVKVDGAPAHAGAARWVTAGVHLVELDEGGRQARKLVKVAPNRTTQVTPRSKGDAGDGAGERDAPAGARARAEGTSARPADKAAAAADTATAAKAPEAAVTASPASGPDKGSSGISQAWFWTGVGLTAVAGGLTIASGVDTINKHRVFAVQPTDEARQAGVAADTRTQLLSGVTAALGVGTAVLGLFAVQWKSADASVTARAAAGPGGAGVGVSGRF